MVDTFADELSKIERRYKSGTHLTTITNLKQRLTSKPIVLFGLGFFGAVIAKNFLLHDISVQCFCDSKKTGIDHETSLPILSPVTLKNHYPNANIVISVAAPRTQQAIHEQLVKLGFTEEQIFTFDTAYKFLKKSRVEVVNLSYEEISLHLNGYKWVYELFKDDLSKKVVLDTINGYLFNDIFPYNAPEEMYFPDELVLQSDEIFIDAGLYRGDTTKAFIGRTGSSYKRILGFDIDEENIKTASSNLHEFSNMDIIAQGLWDHSGYMKAELGLLAGSNLNENAEHQVSLVSLDTIFKDRPFTDYPTFIKMDIEGSEKEALRGAQHIIKTTHPKIAVCTYHKPEDIYLIPKLLTQFNPDYRFLLRHYSPYTWDTVLYAY